MLKPPSHQLRDPAAPAARSSRDVLNGVLRYRVAALAILAAAVLAGVAAAILVPPTYRAQARLLALSAGVYDMQAEGGAPSTQQVLNPTDVANVEIQLLESAELHRTVARAELGDGASAAAVAERAARLESRLHVTKATDANVIQLSYTDRDPNAAAATLKAVIDAYFAARANVLTSGRFGFLSAQLAKAQADLDAVDRQIVTVQRENNVVDIAAQVASAVQQAGDLGRARLEAEAAVAEGQRSIDVLRRGAGQVPRQVELYSDNSEAARAIGEMQTNLLTLRSRRADVASRYMAESPQVGQLDKQIAGLEGAIARQRRELVTTRRVGRNELYDTARDRLTQAEAAAAGSAARRTALGTQEAASRARLTQLIGVSDTLARLRLRRDILADSVRSVSARVEQARIQQDGATSAGSTNVRIVEAPSPPNRRSNPPVLFVAAGVVSGIALAAIALVVLASLRTTWLSAGEASRALDLPVLPVGTSDVERRRAYGELAASVLRGDGAGSTTLLVAPASRRDLQQVALGLGEALDRRAPGKVVLVRFTDDAAAPTNVRDLRVHPLERLATTVVGTAACLRPGVAAELLGELRRRWDHVVVTVPPAAEGSDGLALAGSADATVLVVHADGTRDAAARALSSAVRDRGGDPLGAVLLGVRDYVPRWIARRLDGTGAA